MSGRTVARLGWSLIALSALLFVLALTMNLSRPQYADLAFTTGELTFVFPFLLLGWFGALIVSRQPSHPIGWLMCAFGLASGLGAFANEYAIYGLISRPGAVAGAAAVAWSTGWLVPIFLALLVGLLLLFPSGHPPSPRWWWVMWLAGIGLAVWAIADALWYWPLRGVDLLKLHGGPEPGGILGGLRYTGLGVGLAGLFAAVISLALRYRRGGGVERQQIKWLVYAVGLIIIGFPLPIMTGMVPGMPSELAADIVFAALFTPLPFAVGFAILRHRLYDIDRLINRTLVYGLLTALLALVYLAGVFLLGQLLNPSGENSELVVAASTLAVAALFRPVRRWLQALVDRRFNRRRYHAALEVKTFRAQLRDEVDLDTISAELLKVLDRTLEPSQATLWLRPRARALR